MARTRASNAASRKAVVAKAPRKNIVPGRSSVMSPTNGGSGKRKGGKGGSSNSLKLWPIPKGQKGLQNFFGGDNRCIGSSSGSSSSSNCMEGTSEQSGEELDHDEPTEPSSSSSTVASDGHTSSPSGSPALMNMLEDITQVNSDSDED